MIKKENIFSIYLNQKAIICLQQLNFINGFKKSTKKKSLSKFINNLIIDFVAENDEKTIKERLLRMELIKITKERNRLDKRIEEIADTLSALKKNKKEARHSSHS